MVDYLIQKCGLSIEKANSASKILTHIKSPEKPDSVLNFLKQSGFNDTHIRDLISKQPRLLTVKVENTLKPKFLFFQELGLYGTPFAEITSRYPHFLRCSIENQLQPTISYLRSFFHTDDNIVKAIKKWVKILSYDLQKQIMPCIEVLRKCGIPDHQISSLIFSYPIFLTEGPQWIETLVTRAEKFGVGRGSGMFVYAVLAMGKMSGTTMEAKLQLFKSFGWSEEDILVAFHKEPRFINSSETKVRALMKVLMVELGLKPCEIASRPKVFLASLEKVLLPRHEVLKILKSRGLVKEGKSLLSVVKMSGEIFLKNYVIRYLDRAPELREAYMVPLGISR
ncbi:Mitochodrial transcription termination factor-related [Cinnamomum micranthum f. kanehirae]|uniref:Mitochodrial transcription termination factor-related n=1 Tax=Cinnamomum micranthum f. kanehirae TaxID=337451 RepID=A0A443NIP9_9MAGN|nr:Mitochodrial transcription termination factor-related [Cinnamomum micranthum f. kanehirae]